MSFCTFGMVQSFGVFQDYYTVSYFQQQLVHSLNLHVLTGSINAVGFPYQQHSFRNQLDRVIASLFGLRRCIPYRKAV